MLSKLWTVYRKEGPSGILFRASRRFARKARVRTADASEYVKSPFYDFSSADMARSQNVTNAYLAMSALEIKTVNWFIPGPIGYPMGGMNTIYNFARFIAKEKGVKNNFIITTGISQQNQEIAEQISKSGLQVTSEHVWTLKQMSDMDTIPACDACIATRWDTAIQVLRFNKTRAKFYFVQDFEPMFYPASVISGLAESTYGFQFPGIVNSSGLFDIYAQYVPESTYFTPAVDSAIYYPPSGGERNAKGRTKIFFYGRPRASRNGFELGLEVFHRLKRERGDAVEIVSAGADWNEKEFGVHGIIQNLGVLKSLQAVADLYRSCDIASSFVFTRHSSYQPLEYMATGVAFVANKNVAGAWLLHDEENCLLAEPTVTDVVQKLSRLIDDPALRARLVQNGQADVLNLSWNTEWEKVWGFMTKQSQSVLKQ